MATTVSERPQTRRSATGWRNPWLLLTLAGLCVGFAAQSRTIWLTLLVAALLAGFYTKAARPRLRSKITGDNVIIDRPPDWAPPSGKLYREGRTEYAAHVARARYDDTKELIASFGQITWPYLRYVAGPSIASNTARLVDIASSYRPRRSHVVAAGAIAATLMGMIAVQIGPVGLSNISLAAGLGVAAIAGLFVISYLMIPNPTTTEGGRVMNNDADKANNHDAEVPTSASDAEDGVEKTSESLGTLAQRRARLDRMFREQRAAEPTVELTPQERQAYGLRDTLTKDRPDADDPLGLGSIDADLAGLIGADLPPESPVESPSLSWGDDVVNTDSLPTAGDTSAAQWAAGASQADDTGELPSQVEVDEDTTPEPIARSHIVWIVPVIGVIVSVVFWRMYLSLDGPSSIAYFCGALLFFSATYWEELIELVYAKLNKTSAGFSEWIKAKFFSQGNLITLATLVGVLLISAAVVSYGVLRSKWEWASVWGHIATGWSPLWTIISFPFGSVERFYYTLLFFSIVRIAWVAGDRIYNKLRFEDGMIRFNRGLVFTKKRAVRASSVVNCEFDPPTSMWPLNKVGTLSVPYKEAMEGSFPSQIRRFPAKGYPTVQRYVSEND